MRNDSRGKSRTNREISHRKVMPFKCTFSVAAEIKPYLMVACLAFSSVLHKYIWATGKHTRVPNRNEWTTQPYICCERYAACDWKGHPLSAILIILFKFHLLLFAFCGRLFKHGENYNEAKHYLRWLFEAEHITLSLKWFLRFGCIVAFPLELGYLTEAPTNRQREWPRVRRPSLPQCSVYGRARLCACG